jgi:hypothetical protein
MHDACPQSGGRRSHRQCLSRKVYQTAPDMKAAFRRRLGGIPPETVLMRELEREPVYQAEADYH